MKNTEIKEMNKDQRLSHLIMLTNSYKQLMVDDIVFGDKFSEEIRRKEFLTAVNILKGVITIRFGEDSWHPLCYLR